MDTDTVDQTPAALRGIDVGGVVCTVGDWKSLRDTFSRSADAIAATAHRNGTDDDPVIRAEVRAWRAAATALTDHGQKLALEMTRRPLSLTPPAAADLPAGLLVDAVDGAAMLDVQARSRAAQNLIAHALANVVRRGWIASQQSGAVVTLRELAEAVDGYLIGDTGLLDVDGKASKADVAESRKAVRQSIAAAVGEAWQVLGPLDKPNRDPSAPLDPPEPAADAGAKEWTVAETCDAWGGCAEHPATPAAAGKHELPVAAGHPEHLGLFELRSVTYCGHCHDRHPCDAALAMHTCAESPICLDVVCGFRQDWQHNRPEIVAGG